MATGVPVQTNIDSSDDYLTTGYWRKNRLPEVTQCPAGQPDCNCPSYRPNCTKAPEDELIGVMTDLSNTSGSGNFAFDVACPNWVKSGMANPQLGFSSLVGPEADRIFYLGNYTDRTWNKISDSDFIGNGTTRSHAVFYRMSASGARVFAAGTIQWALGLDEFGANTSYGPILRTINPYNPDVEVVTQNILYCLRDGGTACV